MLELEVWVVVDENGDYVVANSQADAALRYAEDVNGDGAQRQFRIVLNVPAPRPVELVADVPAESDAGTLRVA
jgi:hypothetical protein